MSSSVVQAHRDNAVPATKPWPEFHQDMCERLNAEQCLVLAAPTQTLATHISQAVDKVLDDDAVSTEDTADAAGRTNTASPTAAPSPLSELKPLLRIQFTAPEHIEMLQGCLAVHGRCPMLALVDMRGDDDGCSYVLDIPTDGPDAERGEDKTSPATLSTTGSESGAAVVATNGLSSSRGASPAPSEHVSERSTWSAKRQAALEASVKAFLQRVALKEEPQAPQGAAPPLGDLVEPRHGVVLAEARAAVTSTWSRLLRSSLDRGEDGGALVVFWSDRCPCCPGVLLLLDGIVWALRKLVNDMYARCCGGDASEVPARSLELFPYLVCNIDENDFPAKDWPSRCCCKGNGADSAGNGEPLKVPSVVAYTHSGRLQRMPFSQPRTVINLVRFIVDHCVGPTCVSFCFYSKVREAAEAMAAALDTDALMQVFPSSSPALARALAAHEALQEGNHPNVAEAIESTAREFRGIVRTHLDASCRAHHASPTVDEAVAAAIASLGQCPSQARKKASETCAAAAVMREQSCCLLQRPTRSNNASPLPFGAAVGPGVKRAREADDDVDSRTV